MELRDQLQQALGSGYTLERELEGGGMSRVFLARDAKLKRDIVVKLLRPELLTGVSIERFEREIHLAATLQHPHIVPLLSTGHVADLPFYTMPFIRGESLRTRLSKTGELPIGETVHILRDIASALAHAHAEGVVHRDIKPENVLLSGGVAVVTDFGVAKAVGAAAAGDPRGLTSVGIALGTPAYMSPEQAGADPSVDHRSDIYSFGCVAYEMLSGASPFMNRPPQQMLAAHVTEAPESLTRRRPKIPTALSAFVMRCLEKRASDRPQSAEDLLAALDALSTPSGGMEPTAARLAPPRSKRALAIALGVTLVAAAGLWLWLKGKTFRPMTVQSTRTVIATTEIETMPAISPDGKLVAYVSAPSEGGESKLFVRQLDRAASVALARDVAGEHMRPCWSPDGSQIFFVALGSAGHSGYLVPYVGGTPRLLIPPDENIGFPSWSADDRGIAFHRKQVILLQGLDGGAPTLLDSIPTRVPVTGFALSPDGSRLAYVLGVGRRIGARTLWTMALPGGQPVRFSDSTSQNYNPVWAPDGRSVLYLSDAAGVSDLYQQRLSRQGEPVGAPIRLTTGLNAESFTLSRDGTRASYAVRRRSAPIFVVDIPGAVGSTSPIPRPVTRETETAAFLDLSPDGSWLAYDSDRSGNNDIYKVSAEGGESIQLTSDSAGDFVPKWSPDGREIAYHRLRAGNRDIVVMSSEGLDHRAVTRDSANESQPAWSPDGRALVFNSYGGLTIVSRERGAGGGWSGRRQLTTSAGSNRARWSPDGKWIAYLSRGGVRLIAATGGAPRTLVEPGHLGGTVQDLVWRSDPAVLYVGVLEGTPGRFRAAAGAASFWAVPLSGRPPDLLLSFDSRPPGGKSDSKDPRRIVGLRVSTSFATDGRRLFIVRVIDEAEIGVLDLKR